MRLDCTDDDVYANDQAKQWRKGNNEYQNIEKRYLAREQVPIGEVQRLSKKLANYKP